MEEEFFLAVCLLAAVRQRNGWKLEWKASLQRVFPLVFFFISKISCILEWCTHTLSLTHTLAHTLSHTHTQWCQMGTRQCAISSLYISNSTAWIAPASPHCVKMERREEKKPQNMQQGNMTTNSQQKRSITNIHTFTTCPTFMCILEWVAYL